jgi:hypothetical protein
VDHRRWDREQWDRAVQAAQWHRLAPLLFRHIQARQPVPADVLAALEEAYLTNAARNLFVSASLRNVLDALASAQIPAMPLKGAALVETVCPDPALREMLDLDVLVPADRLDAANAALAEIGYRPQYAGAGSRADHHHDPALITDEQIVAVELHHHIALVGERSHFDVDELWQRARPAAGHLMPSHEDLLLHVCLHFTRNRLGGSYRRRTTGGALSQVCDIAWIVGGATVNWDALARAARAYRLDTRVFLALFAARELGVAVPVGALQALRPPGFDPRIGRRLVALRVLRDGQHLPVRSVRWMLAPGRDVLAHGWGADREGAMSLARAYMRRARAQVPLAGPALRRPWAVVQDYRLNGQIQALEQRE